MLRGALLGAGNIAQRGHLPIYLQAPAVAARCRIVAVADLCPENLAQLQTAIPDLRIYRQAEELLREVRPDFVDICAPPYAHRELIELAVDHGCHILCEKPLSLTLEDAEAVQRCLQRAPLVFIPGHQYHHAPIWQRVRRALLGGEIGEPRFGVISIQRLRANDGNPFWQPAWRTSEALSGGGILMDHGTHVFYQLQSVFGLPRRIAARVDTLRHMGYGVEDSACCYLEYPRALVRVHLTWAAPGRRTQHRYLGSRGDLRCDERGVRVSSPEGIRVEHFDQGFSSNSDHAEWYRPLLEDFLDRIERSDFGREPLAEAVAAIRCASAAYDASRTGQPVHFDA